MQRARSARLALVEVRRVSAVSIPTKSGRTFNVKRRNWLKTLRKLKSSFFNILKK
jgi:hypothetical protein